MAAPDIPTAPQKDIAVYVDLDGVLRTKRSKSPHVVPQLRQHMPNLVYRGNAFDPIAIACLNAITDKTGARIVMCAADRDINRLRRVLRHAGVRGAFHPNWRTPPSNGMPQRGDEVAAHLAANPEITRWAWLDDVDDALPCQKPRLVLTCKDEGLGPHDVDRALEILGHQPLSPRAVRFKERLAHAKNAAATVRQLVPDE